MKMFNSIRADLILLFLFGLISSLPGQVAEWENQLKKDPDNRELLLNLGKHYHNFGGTKENKDAVRKAEKYLFKLLEMEPENCIALVYYGSVLTMKARDAFFPWDKLKWVKKGISRMDEAVTLESDNPEVRFIRGVNSATMPKMMSRLSVALEDFVHIEKLNREKPLNMTKKFWLPYYYNYGLALYKNKEFEAAKEKYLKTIDVDPESDYAGYARRDLKKIEETNHED